MVFLFHNHQEKKMRIKLSHFYKEVENPEDWLECPNCKLKPQFGPFEKLQLEKGLYAIVNLDKYPIFCTAFKDIPDSITNEKTFAGEVVFNQEITCDAWVKVLNN